MALPKLPTSGLDDVNQRRRRIETLNNVLDHTFDDSRIRTQAEIADGKTPINAAYRPGDVRRYTASAPVSDTNYDGWFSYGDVPVAVDADTVTIAGDVTSRYLVASRFLLVGTAAIQSCRVLTTSYSAPDTTINVIFDDGGSMPSNLVAAATLQGLRADSQNMVVLDTNFVSGFNVFQRNTGSNSSGRITIGSAPDAGLIIAAAGENYSGEYITTSGVSGRSVSFYTTTTGSPSFVPTPMVFAVGDFPRVVIDAVAGPGAAPVRFINASETISLHSPLSAGGVYVTFRRTNAAAGTRMGIFGFDSLDVNDNLRLINEETGAIHIIAEDGNVALNASGSVSLNGTSYSIDLAGLGNFANDGAASAGGVPVSGLYRNGSVLMIRVA